MDRSNHYELAFEAFLQEKRVGYVAVTESHRFHIDETPTKNLDFIVCGASDIRLLIDVKGRQYPTGTKARNVLECWSTQEDIDGMERWEELFGPEYVAVLAFVYQVLPEARLPDDLGDWWTWEEKRYLLRGISVEDYRRHMRVRSPKWGTVTLPRSAYRTLVRPFHEHLERVM